MESLQDVEAELPQEIGALVRQFLEYGDPELISLHLQDVPGRD